MALFKGYDRRARRRLREQEKRFSLFWAVFPQFLVADPQLNSAHSLSPPIVTSGLAETGMAYICRMAARDKHVFFMSDFFGAIKRNWKRALPLGIINVLDHGCLCCRYVCKKFWHIFPRRT